MAEFPLSLRLFTFMKPTDAVPAPPQSMAVEREIQCTNQRLFEHRISDCPNRAHLLKSIKNEKSKRKTCRWTPELDEVLKSAWAVGGLRAARSAIRQYQPDWPVHSIRRRAAALRLPSRPRGRRWTDRDTNDMLWAIDSNASLALIAERLGRTVSAIRHKLQALGYTVESLGGYKVKEVAEMCGVTMGRVRHWVARKWLLTKGGRITDSSLSKFLADHPERIAFEMLTSDMQNWLREMGYCSQESAEGAPPNGQTKTASGTAQANTRGVAIQADHSAPALEARS